MKELNIVLFILVVCLAIVVSPSFAVTTCYNDTIYKDNYTDIIGDVSVRLSNPTTNYGNLNTLYISTNWHPYIMLNTTRFINATIYNAMFGIRIHQSGDSANLSLYHVYDLNGTTEKTMTWNTQPCGTLFDNSTFCNLTEQDSKIIPGSILAPPHYDTQWNITRLLQNIADSQQNELDIAINSDQSGLVYAQARLSDGTGYWSAEWLNVSYCVVDFDKNTGYVQTGMIKSFTGKTEQFNLTVNASNEIVSMDAILKYNSTNYSASKNTIGNVTYFTATVETPYLVESKNITFYWIYTTQYPDGNYTNTTTHQNQTAYPINITDCSDFMKNPSLNFTFLDDSTSLLITNNVSFNLILNAKHKYGGTTIPFVFSRNDSSTYELCIIDPDALFTISGTLLYNSTGYYQKLYTISSTNINGTKQSIQLVLTPLSTSIGEMIFTIQDASLQRKSGVFLKIQKKNLVTGEFVNISSSETDANGQTVVDIEKGASTIYKLIVYDTDGTTILTTISTVNFASIQTTYTITIPTGGFFFIHNINVTCLPYNATTSIFNCTVNDTRNVISSINFKVRQLNNFQFSNTCDKSESLTYATFNCTLPNNSSYFEYIINVVFDGQTILIEKAPITMPKTAGDWGTTGLFITAMLLIVMFFVSIKSPSVALVGAAVVLITTTLFGMNDISTAAIGGIIVVIGIGIVKMGVR